MGRVFAARPGVATRLVLIIAVGVACLMFGAAGASASTAVTDVTASPNTTSAGATEAIYTVQFTATTALTAGTDTITLEFPSGIQLDPSTGTFEITTDPANPNAQDWNDAFATTVNISGTEATITVPSGIAINAGTVVEVQAYGVSNPTATATNQSVTVFTSQDTGHVASSPTFAITPATHVSDADVTENTNSAGATGTVVTASFTASDQGAVDSGGTALNSSGYVRIALPSGFSFVGADDEEDVQIVINNGTPTGPGGADAGYLYVDPDNLGNNVLDIYAPDQGINAGDQVTIHIHGVANPGSEQSGQTASISTSTDGANTTPITLDTSSSTEIQTGATVTSLSQSADATRVHDQITFTADQPIAAAFTLASEYPQDDGGYVTLTAPAGTVFPHSSGEPGAYDFDYVLVDDTTSSPTYDTPGVTVNPGGAGYNVVRLDVPVDIAAGDEVTVDIYGVSNPTTANPGNLDVSTSSDIVPDPLSLATDSETGPSGVSAIESDPTPGASNVTYTANLTATHGLTSDDPEEGSGGLIGDLLADPVSDITLSAPGATFPSDPTDYSIQDGATTFEPAAVTLLDGGGALIDIGSSPSDDVAAGDQLVVTVSDVTNASDNVGISSVSTSSDPGTVAPPIPTDVSATPGNVSATVTWAAASVSGLTGYLVTPYVGDTPQMPFTTTGTGTTATIAGLTNGTAYTFTVAAITAAGTGSPSAHSPAVTPGPPVVQTPGFGTSTAAINFGSVGVGVTSPASTVTVSNTGSASLQISNVAVSGADAKEFAISSDKCTGQTLASGVSCTVSLTVTPSSTGSQTASLSFTDNASGSPQSIALSGTGTKLGSVSGTVTNDSGKAVSGASISICPDGANGIELGSSACVSGTSAANGSYSLAGLAPGQWDIQVQPTSSSLFPGSAILSVQAGSNTEDFSLSAPKALPTGYTFDGVDGPITSGVPTINWQQPFSFTFPYSIPAGKPNTETALVYTAAMSPTGGSDEADQPSVSGSVVLLVSYDATGKPTLESVESDPESGPDPQLVTAKASSSFDRARVQGSGPTAVAAGGGDLSTYLLMTEAGLAAVNDAVVNGTLQVASAGLSSIFHGGAEVTINGKIVFSLPPGSKITITKDQVIITTPKGQPIVPFKPCPPVGNRDFRRYGAAPDQGETCPAPPGGGFDDYTDPAGTVKTTAGAPVPDARVTLSRSATKKGEFKKVPNGSTIMSISNRRNPSFTTAGGLFSWDTLPGFYEVAATKSGCRTTSKSTSQPLKVPPPALGIGLTLRCTHLTRSKTRVKITAKKVKHSELVELIVAVSGAKRHVPTGSLKLSIDGRAVVTAPLGRKGTLVWDSNAATTKSVVASYGGDGYNQPSHAMRR
jgi:Abnormal spindle-like microcephaly-assoc'd, ASPM-SPD-2-Hydin/Fibronectin type III domain